MSKDVTKIQELLLDFYSNQENTRLANYYATPTLFDMIKKSRSETVHSAVIKWILEGNDFPNQGSNSTLMHFLQTILRRKIGIGFGEKCINQNNAQFDESLANAIYSDTLKLANIEIATEKSVGDFGVDTDDRLDIYIKCDTNIPIDNKKDGKDFKTLEIFIENKVCSTENLPKNAKYGNNKIILNDLTGETKRYKGESKEKDNYENLYQTDRYYCACKNKEHIQLFVFLSALNKSELDFFKKLTIGKERCWCDKFVQICYQDLLDYVIEPQLSVENMPDRAKNWLEEYVKCLSVPAAETDEDGNVVENSDQVIMAVTATERKVLKEFFESDKNKQLLDIVFSQYSIQDYYKVGNKTNLTFEEALINAFKDYKMPENLESVKIAKVKNKKDFLKSKIGTDKNYIKITEHLFANKSFNTETAIFNINSVLEKQNLDTIEVVKKEYKDLLNPFWDKYQPLILSALNIYSQGAEVSPYYKDLYRQFTKADNTKFIIGEDNTIVGKREVVVAFIKYLWDHNQLNNDIEVTNNFFKQLDIKVASSYDIILSKQKFKELQDSEGQNIENKRVKSTRYKNDTILGEDYYVSTQWGGKINSTRKIDNFPKVWKEIEKRNQGKSDDEKFIVKVASV